MSASTRIKPGRRWLSRLFFLARYTVAMPASRWAWAPPPEDARPVGPIAGSTPRTLQSGKAAVSLGALLVAVSLTAAAPRAQAPAIRLVLLGTEVLVGEDVLVRPLRP